MTMADDPRAHTPLTADEAVGAEPLAADMLPPTEREHDPQRSGYMRSLEDQPAHPLTDEEKEAAKHDPGVSERVYAPASARVPKEPVPGHDDIVDAADPNTPERRAAGWSQPASPTTWREPAGMPTESSRPDETSYLWNNASTGPDWKLPAAAVGAAALAGAIGGWLYYQRWQRERNRPINRLRRQAREVVYVVVDRLPSRDELVEVLPGPEQARPAGGAGLLALALAFLASRILQRRSRREAVVDQAQDHLSDASEKWLDQLLSAADRVRARAAEATDRAQDRAEEVSQNGHSRLLPFRR